MPIGGDDDTVAGALSDAEPGHEDIPALVAGRYQIVRWLGGGGMGRVYEALDTELGESVALKVLRSGLSDDASARFRREVKLTRRIVHRNVARMFDIGEHAGERFLTMELVDGAPLTVELGPPMAWTRLQPLAIQMCDGLAAAHRAGVIHRDLKPDNVLVERGSDRVVITDFGIARSGDDDLGGSVTRVGTVIGTPRYMAPEQLAGEPVDARADIFSLGVMLYEMATGQRPWAGDNAIAIAVAQVTQAAPPIRAKVSAAFVAVVERCLALAPAQRPATAEEVREAIAASTLAADRPTPAPRSMVIPPASPTPDPTSLAVLPFSCSDDDTYVADGIVEDLVDTLSATAALRVRPAGIARSREARDPRELGRALAVDHVVIGSVRRSSTGLRVSARLIGVADGFQIWAHRVEGSEGDMLSASEQLSAGIARALSTLAVADPRQMDPRAVDLYLRARAELRRFWGIHAQAAADLLEQAAAFAPSSAQVVSALAVARVQAWLRRGTPDYFPVARAAVDRALALGHGDAFLAEGLLALNTGDQVAAARSLGRAAALAPMSAPVNESCAHLLVEIDSLAEGRRRFETALGLDPGRAHIINAELARVDRLEGNVAAAQARLAPVVADPDPSIARFGALFAVRIAIWDGDSPGLEGSLTRLNDLLTSTGPDLGATAGHHMIRTYAAWKRDATFDVNDWDRSVQFDPDRPHRNQLAMLQRQTEVALMIEQPAAALRALRKAADCGLIDLVYLERCPALDPLRSDAGFHEIRAIVEHRAHRALAAFRASAA